MRSGRQILCMPPEKGKQMENTVRCAVKKYYGTELEKLIALGGGFYGKAFLAKLDREPYSVVLKAYRFPGYARKEAAQIQILSEHALLKMPKIFRVVEKKESGLEQDLLFMEYIKSVNGGDLDTAKLPEAVRDQIGEEIVENLIAFHNTVNPGGFGEIDASKYDPSWENYYHGLAEKILEKAKSLLEQGEISKKVYATMMQAQKEFDQIFYLPVKQASLVHGDYNTWNIMLDEKKEHAIAVIDPFNCRWADREIDLYQLDNANGKSYGLLKKYAEKVPLSENFDQKMRFYQLFTEVCHYYDSHVPVDLKAVEKMAAWLDEIL